MKKAIVVSVLALAVMTAGCATPVADFTIVSTKTIQLNRIDLKNAALTRNVESTDSRVWFLFIPLGSTPKIKEAMDKCLEQGNGDYMTNAVIYDEGWSLLLFSYGGFMVKGDVGNSMAGPVYNDRR